MSNRITLEAILNAAGIKRGADDANRYLGGLSNAVQGMLPVLSGAAIGAALGKGFMEFASADRGLNLMQQAMKNTGIAATMTKPQIAAWADQMESITGLDDAAFVGALTRMTLGTQDFAGSIAAMPKVANMAIAFEKDLTTAAIAYGAATEGNVAKLTRMIPELQGIAKEGMSVIEVLDLINKRTEGFSEASMEGAAGGVSRLKIAWDDFLKSLGSNLDKLGGSRVLNFLASGMNGVGMLSQGDIGGAMGFTPMGGPRDWNWDRGTLGPTGSAVRVDPSKWTGYAPPPGFTGPPSPYGASYNGWWDSLAMRDMNAEASRPMGIVGWNGLRGAFKSGGGFSNEEDSETPSLRKLVSDSLAADEARVKAQLTNIFQSAITAGIHGSAKDVGKVFFDAVTNALAQKAAGNAADKIFGAAKGMAGPLGWLFG